MVQTNNQLFTEDLEEQVKQVNSQQPTNIVVKKRSAVRQKLAIALMAIGGTLVAGFIWYLLDGKNSG